MNRETRWLNIFLIDEIEEDREEILREWELLADQILEEGEVYRRRRGGNARYGEVSALEKWQYALDTVETRHGINYEDPLELIRDYALEEFEPAVKSETDGIESETMVRDRSAADKIYRGVRLYQEGRKEEGIKMSKLINKRNLT